MDEQTVVSALPGVTKEDADAAEAWLNSPLGATVRRLGITLLGLALPFIARYIPFASGANPDVVVGMLELVIAAYVFQSMHHSAQKVKADAQVAAVKAVPDVAAAIVELKK